MNTFLAEIRQTVLPNRGGQDGPLPPLLVTLTFVTGLVDAFSYLVLGHVFVANMTGNVVFLGFAIAGAPGFSIGASVVALAMFWLGALVGGRVGKSFGTHRGRLLSTATAIQAAFIGASVILASLSGSPVTSGYRYALIAGLAIAMGVQNAAARQIAVPDLTTTVLTLTITGIAADSAIAGGKGSKSGRRLVAVAAMLVGALVGAACVLHVHIVFALVIALIVLAIVGVTTRILGKSDASWAEG
jgi:uncharacterized membrane protein YoaK (UPF0700 family)